MQRGFLGGLLGAAAGIALVPTAIAADMPVKAKPVEYVKVCSAYGAGFYYIPGTDICLRVGGYIFAEAGVKARNAAVSYPFDRGFFTIAADGTITVSPASYRNANYTNWRSRGHVILDARNNTAYGTVRAYFSGGVSVNNAANGAPLTAAQGVQGSTYRNVGGTLDRAFIQFAGITAGYTESFFSFGGAYSIVSSNALSWDWLSVLGYTAQLGNGISATISVEDGQNFRTGAIGGAAPAAAGAAVAYGGGNAPDIVANVRVDQSWGSAQIMGALHEVRPSAVNIALGTDWGFAIGAGVEVKTPQTGAPNNSLLLQGVWSKGSVERTGISGNPLIVGGVLAFGPAVVATFADAYANPTATGLSLTEAWSVYAGYRHYWTPALRTGFSFGYTDVDKPTHVTSPDLSIAQAAVSTIWSPVSGLDLSLDIVWTRLKHEDLNAASAPAQRSEDLWSAWYRVRRNF